MSEAELFRVVRRTLEWAEVEADPADVADLVMLDLINIKEVV